MPGTEKIFSVFTLFVFFLVGAPLGAQTGEAWQEAPQEGSGPADRAGAPGAYEARPVDGTIRVDGVLGPGEWAGAAPLRLAWEVSPGENRPAPVETVCRIAFDEENLYLGCEARDPDPTAVRAYVTDRDGIADHDRIVLTLDPFRDARRGFVFGISALGVQQDALFNQQGTGSMNGGDPQQDRTWDAIWSSAGRVTEEGYVVEAAIPFRSLRFPEDAAERPWGLLVSRFRPRSSNVELRSAPLDRSDACVLCQAGLLDGLSDISPGGHVQLSPTLTASRSDRPDEASPGLQPGAVTVDPGLDVRWSPTPELAVNATVNPDFSQVEADAAQLDVNRSFALFFPEKRPFFQESADVFETPVRAVFTRTVLEPLAGAKVTGKVGPYALGGMLVLDEVNSLVLPGTQGSSSLRLDESVTTGVARVRRDLGASSTLGALLVAREGAGYHNRVAGADAFLQPWPTVTARLQAVRSWTRYPGDVAPALEGPPGPTSPSPAPVGEEFTGDAIQGQLRYQSRSWIANSDVRYRGEGFRADAGFQPQVGVRGANASVARVFWGGGDRWYDRLSTQVGVWRNEEISGALLDGGLWLGFSYNGPLQSHVTFFPNLFRSSFAGEEYPMATYYFNVGIRPAGALGLAMDGEVGDVIDYANARKARQLLLRPTLDLRLGRRTSLELSHRMQRLETDESGREILTAHVSEARAVYNFSNRAFVRAVVQHRLTDFDPALHDAEVPTRARSVFSQLLFSYKVNPQTLLFLGWTDDRAGATTSPDRSVSFDPRGRVFFLKVGYAWRP